MQNNLGFDLEAAKEEFYCSLMEQVHGRSRCVCISISTEQWLHRERDSDGAGTTGKSKKSWGVLVSFLPPLVSPGNCKHLGQRIENSALLVKLLTCFCVKTMHTLIVLIS